LINSAFNFPTHQPKENKFVKPFSHFESIFGKISIIPLFLIKKQLMFKKLLSYILPITILKQKSTLSQTIEVTWTDGKLVLDSENTNYSYGNLQIILRKGLKIIGFERIKSMENILVLGVAGGSVIRTLVDEINFKGQITGVEIDKAIIEIANTYFNLGDIPNLEIIIDDASKFVLKTNKKYDLIIIDIFQDTKMPDFLFEFFFINRLCYLLKPKGYILFNTMLLNYKQKQLNLNYVTNFDSKKYTVTTHNKMDQTNELILIESKF
jgi:predicted membrane-bound spermidine synthase